MALKVYSDRTKKFYDSTAEAAKAEADFIAQERAAKLEVERKAAEEKERKEKEAAERKAMAAEIEEARKTMLKVQKNCKEQIDEAQKDYRNKINAFVKKYGSYHWSSNSADDVPTLFDIFNPFFKDFLN